LKEEKVSRIVSNLMKISAESSPKASGDYLDIVVLDDAEREMLAEEMFQLSNELEDETYSEKGEAVEASEEVILIGLNEHPPLGLNCRACGYDDCNELSDAEETEDIFKGPNCTFRLLDLGTALGNSLSTADIHGFQPDISIRGGLAAKHLGLIDANICLAVTTKVVKDKNYFTP